MSENRGSREREIFEACLELDAESREDFLLRACAGDDALWERVRLLLDAHGRAEAEGLTPGTAAAEFEVPDRIGPYQILEPIGEGGMGVVYLAEQVTPIRRRVALKIIKLGMDTKEVIARFESERQALALMDHPSIARILDAGATERGRPYFVMEFVKGIPITRYCDRKRLGVRERLELFMGVLGAVQHAHQKGVIHRDLKPSNILITETDGVPVPKVIDFGVAKATSQRLSDRTLHTRLGTMIGTPDYMSPEQAEMTPLDVDTRSDIYALGVILYELLAGVRPLELTGKSIVEVQQAIVDQTAETPAARLRGLGGSADAVAGARGTSLKQLHRRLRGDLGRIALNALHKDPRHRYQTALAFADDIDRYLNDEPVKARVPALTYRLQKFVTRHAAAVAGVAGVGILLVLLVTFYTLRLAAERDRATTEAETAEQVTEFLVELFSVSDPSEARGSTVTARELLDLGAERVSRELEGQPEVQATLLHSIGRVYLELGLIEQARAPVEQAVALRRGALGDEHAALAESLNLLGEIAYARRDYEAADALVREGLAIRRAVLGERHPDVAESLNDVGAVAWAQGNLEEAEARYREALALREDLLGTGHPDVLESVNNLAVLLHTQGELEAAEPLYRQVLEVRQAELGEDHPRTLNSLYNLGFLLWVMDDDTAAERLLRRSLDLRRQVLGNEHPETLESLGGLARVLISLGDNEGAEPLLREALALQVQLRGEEGPATRALLERILSGS